MTAEPRKPVPPGCACVWQAVNGGPWTRVRPDPRCPDGHEEDG